MGNLLRGRGKEHGAPTVGGGGGEVRNMRHLLRGRGKELGAPTAGERLGTWGTYCGGEVRNMGHLLWGGER